MGDEIERALWTRAGGEDIAKGDVFSRILISENPFAEEGCMREPV